MSLCNSTKRPHCLYSAAIARQHSIAKVTLPDLQFHWKNLIWDLQAYIYKLEQENAEYSVFEIQPNGLVVTSSYYGAAILW